MALESYTDIFKLNEDEKLLKPLTEEALYDQRVYLKGAGYEVTALSMMQKLRNRLQDPSADNSLEAGGLDLAEHPELAELGGEVDPNNIVLPESEAAARASNDPKLQNKLRARMAAKMGVSQYLSREAMEEEYKKKMRARIELTEQPRFRPVEAPKNRPS